MVDGKLLIEKLLFYAKEFLNLSSLDEIYKKNILLHLFNLDSPSSLKVDEEEISKMDQILEKAHKKTGGN